MEWPRACLHPHKTLVSYPLPTLHFPVLTPSLIVYTTTEINLFTCGYAAVHFKCHASLGLRHELSLACAGSASWLV